MVYTILLIHFLLGLVVVVSGDCNVCAFLRCSYTVTVGGTSHSCGV